jgi:hypothetical protein
MGRIAGAGGGDMIIVESSRFLPCASPLGAGRGALGAAAAGAAFGDATDAGNLGTLGSVTRRAAGEGSSDGATEVSC